MSPTEDASSVRGLMAEKTDTVPSSRCTSHSGAPSPSLAGTTDPRAGSSSTTEGSMRGS
ncbi:hypothetical protein [Corallococcus aberystwythensis]|uniref:hypothetical protein n=1 Tax=Corallococcus aberystwythensis TaxID=2316722 RepID=UPI00131530CD|nr:hypothetical protein [Corallococcus aberystwythensis]